MWSARSHSSQFIGRETELFVEDKDAENAEKSAKV